MSIQGTDIFGYRAWTDRREQQGAGPRLSLDISGFSMPMAHIWSICSPPLQDWRSPNSYKHVRSGTNPNDIYPSITECLCLWLNGKIFLEAFILAIPKHSFPLMKTFVFLWGVVYNLDTNPGWGLRLTKKSGNDILQEMNHLNISQSLLWLLKTLFFWKQQSKIHVNRLKYTLQSTDPYNTRFRKVQCKKLASNQ